MSKRTLLDVHASFILPKPDLPVIVDGEGMPRLLSCLPRVTEVGEAFPVLGSSADALDLIPESEWSKYETDNTIESAVWHIIDQGQQGSCNAAACCGAAMDIREMSNYRRVVFSQASVYGPINGGRDQGSSIDSGLRQMVEIGACPIDVIDQYDWRGYWNGSWPADWKIKAAPYRALEVWDCPSYAHAVSACFRGCPVVFGVFWSGGGGHAIVMVRGGRTKAKIRNSWGRSYGTDGIGELPRSQIEQGIRYFGAWAFRVATDPAAE